MHPPIRAVVFDFGNVLSMPQGSAHVERMAAMLGLDRQAFRRGYAARRPEYDQGLIDSAAYWQEVARVGHGGSAQALSSTAVTDLVSVDIDSWTVMRAEMLAWAHALQTAGVRTGILSNMPEDHAAAIRARYRWLKSFDVPVFSAELRLAKPDPRIYRACIELIGLAGEAILFLDDLEPNVAAARAAGMQAEVFTDVPSLRRTLERYAGIPVAP